MAWWERFMPWWQTAYLEISGAPVVTEGNDGQTVMRFTVKRSGRTDNVVSCRYKVSGTVSGADFVGSVLPTGLITLQKGELTKVVDLPIRGDRTIESDEKATVTLSSPVGARIRVSQASGTIKNDDVAVPTPTPTPTPAPTPTPTPTPVPTTVSVSVPTTSVTEGTTAPSPVRPPTEPVPPPTDPDTYVSVNPAPPTTEGDPTPLEARKRPPPPTVSISPIISRNEG